MSIVLQSRNSVEHIGGLTNFLFGKKNKATENDSQICVFE